MIEIEQSKNLKSQYLKLKRELFDIRYSFLNERQREAVYVDSGPLLILAGAGSGKTTVLVNRIAFLVKYGNAYFGSETPDINENEVATLEGITKIYRQYSGSDVASNKDGILDGLDEILSQFIYNPYQPYTVLAITFTNKAANEMKERLKKNLGEEIAGDIWAGTFHSICVRILRRFIDRLGLGYSSNFTIYDADDVKKQVTDTMKSLNIDDKIIPVRSVMTAIGRYKDKLKYPQDIGQTADVREERIKRIYESYQESLRKSNAVDFDDIIALTVRLLQIDSEVREYYAGRFRHVLVDEYQDTNYAQYVLVTLLSGKHKNIMVVGDDDQSIYKFRGATIENILNFSSRFEDAKTVRLEQNYRSTKNILNAANEIIKNNEGRLGKSLWTDNPSGRKISVKEIQNQIDEANYIVEKIKEISVSETKEYRDFAVLYRVNAQSASLELAFAKNSVPYRTIGGIRFYDRKEIKDMIAYFKVICNPADTVSLKRIINEPKRGIGGATVVLVEQIAASKNMTMFDVIKSVEKHSEIGRSGGKLKNFAALITGFMEAEQSELLPELFERIFEESGYRAMLEAAGEEEKDRLENVKELISQAIAYSEKCEGDNQRAALAGFLEEVALVSDVDNYDREADAVTLMTIHSAKGLEFPVVFLPGMEDNVFPSTQSVQTANTLGDNEAIEEERRLAYVAVTRAKDRLFLTHARERLLYGRTNDNNVSRFITEIPDNIIEYAKLSNSVQRQSQITFASSKKYPPKVPANGEFATKYTTVSSEAGERAARGKRRFKKGDAVVHNSFGSGLVIDVTDVSGDIMYEIAFDTVGTKKMMDTYTRSKLELRKDAKEKL